MRPQYNTPPLPERRTDYPPHRCATLACPYWAMLPRRQERCAHCHYLYVTTGVLPVEVPVLDQWGNAIPYPDVIPDGLDAAEAFFWRQHIWRRLGYRNSACALWEPSDAPVDAQGTPLWPRYYASLGGGPAWKSSAAGGCSYRTPDIAYEMASGLAIPPSLYARGMCGQVRCGNPAHLQLVRAPYDLIAVGVNGRSLPPQQ